MRVGPLTAALGLAGLIAATGTTIAVARHHGPTHPTATPIVVSSSAPEPTPSPTARLIPPPPGVDLIWRTVADNDRILEALDWSGTLRGRLLLPDAQRNLGGVYPSPDGQRLLLMEEKQYRVLTAQGQDLGVLAATSDPHAADAFQHFCTLSSDVSTNALSADLSLLTLGGPTRAVSHLHLTMGGDGGARIAACNLAKDIAVLSVVFGDDSAGHVVEVKVVRLSTGATLRDVRPPEPDFRGTNPRGVPGSLESVVASPDGTLLALIPYTGDLQESPQTPVQIVDTVSGRVLGHVNGYVTDFIDDDTVAGIAGVVDWRTGRVVAKPVGCCGIVLAQPHGPGLVLQVLAGPSPTPGTAAQPGTEPTEDYILVLRDGTRTRIACCGAKVL